MQFSRPRPSILSLFDPLSSTPELDRTTSPDSDKENDLIDTSFFHPFGSAHSHVHVPPRTLKSRLVDVGDTTVEHPDIYALLCDELEQELSYIVNDDDDENNTLTFRDMAKAATPKWPSCDDTELETPKVSPPRTPLAEISLKDELTPLARRKHYRRQPVPSTPKGPQSFCLTSPPPFSPHTSSGCAPSYAEVPEVRVNDEPILQSSPSPANFLGDSNESSSSSTLDQLTPTKKLGVEPPFPTTILPLPYPEFPHVQTRARHLSPVLPTDNAHRYSVDLQTSFQIHFQSPDITFDLLKDKISFFGSRNDFDSFCNNLEEESSFDDISVPGPRHKIEDDLGVLSTITLNEAQSVIKRKIDHPTPVSKDVGATELSKASSTNTDVLTPVQSNQIHIMPCTKATLVQRHAFQTPSTRPLPLVADNFHPLSTPSSFADNSRRPPPQIPALRIIKRSKTTTQQRPSKITKDSPPQDVSIPIDSCVPVADVLASSLATTTKKDRPSELNQVRRTDETRLPPSLPSNGPRRVLISEGPKLNSAPNSRASANHGQLRPCAGPRRVATAVPPIIERVSSSARPPVQSSGLRQPIKYGTAVQSIVKPVQRTVGSRLPAITRRTGIASGVDSGNKGMQLPT